MAYRDPKKRTQAHRRWLKAHPGYYKQRRRDQPEKYRSYSRTNHLKRKYNITPERFEQMLVEQNGVCAICRQNEISNKKARRLSVDHNHQTQQVRGLLCRPCNSIIGYARESVEVLLAAVAYLKRHAT